MQYFADESLAESLIFSCGNKLWNLFNFRLHFYTLVVRNYYKHHSILPNQ